MGARGGHCKTWWSETEVNCDVEGARGGHCKTWWSETEVKCDVWELLDDIASLSRRLIRCRETRKMTYKSFKEVNCHVREPEKEMARPVRMP